MKLILDNLSFEKWTEKDILNLKILVRKEIKSYVNYFKKLKLDKNLNFKNTFLIGEIFSGEISNLIGPVGIVEYVHIDPKMRETARKEQIIFDKDFTKLAYNESIYKVYKYYFEKNFKSEKKYLSQEEIKIVEEAMLGYKRMGMHLLKSKKIRLQKINNEMSKLSSLYNKDCAEYYKKGVWFTKEEMDGLDENFIKSLKYDDKNKKYFVSSTLSSHNLTFLSQCKVEASRVKLVKDFELGANPKNLERLGSTLKLRQEKAKILGYKNFIAYQTEEQIINSEQKIYKFLKQVEGGLKTRTKKEFKELKENFNLELNRANILFMENELRLKKANLDLKKVSEYFELENTLEALFKIWSDFFQVETKYVRNVDVFGDDTRLYHFYDKKTGDPIASCIFDLFPREGKYGHACVANLKRRYFKGDELNLASGILICNFIRNKEGKTLLSFNDVTTLFHEGGHMLHKILCKNNYPSTGMSGVSTDFVEIPSQFLENFVTSKEGLALTSRHYITGEKLPVDIQKNIKYADHYLLAYSTNRQINFGKFDLTIHGPNILNFARKPKTIDLLYNKSFFQTTGIKTLNFENFGGHFAHIMGGYESKYYSYLVSLAYVHHVWDSFIKKGLNSKNVQIEKYKTLLQTGAMKKELKMLRDFLGEEPSVTSFVKYLDR